MVECKLAKALHNESSDLDIEKYVHAFENSLLKIRDYIKYHKKSLSAYTISSAVMVKAFYELFQGDIDNFVNYGCASAAGVAYANRCHIKENIPWLKKCLLDEHEEMTENDIHAGIDEVYDQAPGITHHGRIRTILKKIKKEERWAESLIKDKL